MKQMGTHYSDKNEWSIARQYINRGDNSMLEKAISIFKNRLENKYLIPIKHLQSLSDKDSPGKGEGFAIMTLACCLIEFLQSTREGVVYKHKDVNSTSISRALPYEYSSSSKLTIEFLTKNEPFKSYFTSNNKAAKFYDQVRNGLVHEAATKKKTLIHRTNNQGLLIKNEADNYIVYRDIFVSYLRKYFKSYIDQIRKDQDLMKNFTRKMDYLYDEGRIACFCYGYNMAQKSLEERLPYPPHSVISIARAVNYSLEFNKPSIVLGEIVSSVANLKNNKGMCVWGVLYELDSTQFNCLINEWEKGYNVIKLKVLDHEMKSIEAKAFIFQNDAQTTNKPPKREYIQRIIEGANEHQLPDDYIHRLECVRDGL